VKKLLIALLFVVSISILLGSQEAYAFIPVTKCGILDIPGETYVLQNNIIAPVGNAGGCLVIGEDNIILDGNFFEITRIEGGVPLGISIIGRENIKIQNTKIVGIFFEGFSSAVNIDSSTNISVVNNELIKSQQGIRVHNSADIEISENTILDILPGGGIRISLSNGITVNDNTVGRFGTFGVFFIQSSNIVLTGNEIFRDLDLGNGITLVSSSDIILSDNIIDNTDEGMRFSSSNNIEILRNSITHSRDEGISLIQSSTILVKDNLISDGQRSGIQSTSTDVIYQENQIIFNNNGFVMSGAVRNTIERNSIIDSKSFAIILEDSSDNLIFNNNFIGNGGPRVIGISPGNVWNLNAPIGGNYWSVFDEIGEGCFNTSPIDDFCDEPFFFTGGQDNLPWTRQDGWIVVDGTVGGELIPVETTTLILAGAQSFSWMIPVVLSGIGIGLFVVSRKSE